MDTSEIRIGVVEEEEGRGTATVLYRGHYVGRFSLIAQSAYFKLAHAQGALDPIDIRRAIGEGVDLHTAMSDDGVLRWRSGGVIARVPEYLRGLVGQATAWANARVDRLASTPMEEVVDQAEADRAAAD